MDGQRYLLIDRQLSNEALGRGKSKDFKALFDAIDRQLIVGLINPEVTPDRSQLVVDIEAIEHARELFNRQRDLKDVGFSDVASLIRIDLRLAVVSMVTNGENLRDQLIGQNKTVAQHAGVDAASVETPRYVFADAYVKDGIVFEHDLAMTQRFFAEVRTAAQDPKNINPDVTPGHRSLVVDADVVLKMAPLFEALSTAQDEGRTADVERLHGEIHGQLFGVFTNAMGVRDSLRMGGGTVACYAETGQCTAGPAKVVAPEGPASTPLAKQGRSIGGMGF